MPFIDKSPLTYRPNSTKSLRRFQLDRAPTSSDYRNFQLGDEWLDTSSQDWWKLCDKDTTSGTWKKMAGTGGPVESFLPDSGTSPVIPDASNQVTVTGGTGIETVGSLNTVTWNLDQDVAQQYVTDGGTATPSSNSLNVLGGTSISTTGVGDTVTVIADGDLANQYTTDSGIAVPAANNLNIVGGTGVSTSGAGTTVTITATSTGLAWVDVTVVAQLMAVDTAYGANNAGGVVFTLPVTAAQGTVIEIVGIQGLWSLAQNAGQQVHSGLFSTTIGVGGSLTATVIHDCIVLRCTVANTEWVIQNMMGNITIV
jgi:hypothetical protein